MRVRRFHPSHDLECADDIKTLILLMADSNDRCMYAVAGDNDALKDLFISGAVYWPILLPYSPETQAKIQNILRRAQMLDFDPIHRRIYDFFSGSDILRKGFGRDREVFVLGEEREMIAVYDAEGFWRGDRTFIGMPASLMFFRQGDKNHICQNGFASRKQLLLLSAIEDFFGREVRIAVEDAVLGSFREVWYKMAGIKEDTGQDLISG